jgi:SanA protein
MTRRLRMAFTIFLSLAVIGVAGLSLAWWRVSRCGAFAHDGLTSLPHRKVAVVLGCSPTLSDGSLNYFFLYRMDAAAKLLKSGKVEYLLVSGDNRRRDYDEPTAMKKALIARGIPADRIVCDYAGLTTLDSIVRAKAIFGQPEITIVSQRFHTERAIYLARAYGLNAVGYNANDVPLAAAPRTYIREVLSRVRAFLDANIVRRQPRHLGDPIVIGAAG